MAEPIAQLSNGDLAGGQRYSPAEQFGPDGVHRNKGSASLKFNSRYL